jgi:hypothetical protein
MSALPQKADIARWPAVRSRHDSRLLLRQINEAAPRSAHSSGLASGEIRLSSSNDWKKTVRLNKLLGMWAAEKLGITGREAEAYSDALAVGTLDPERSDVLTAC